jgi:hypothetical protein
MDNTTVLPSYLSMHILVVTQLVHTWSLEKVPLENPRFVETIAHRGDTWAVSEEIKVMQS